VGARPRRACAATSCPPANLGLNDARQLQSRPAKARSADARADRASTPGILALPLLRRRRARSGPAVLLRGLRRLAAAPRLHSPRSPNLTFDERLGLLQQNRRGGRSLPPLAPFCTATSRPPRWLVPAWAATGRIPRAPSSLPDRRVDRAFEASGTRQLPPAFNRMSTAFYQGARSSRRPREGPSYRERLCSR